MSTKSNTTAHAGPIFTTVPGLAAWASYLINGDDSGISAEDARLAERWLAWHGVAFAVSIVEDSERFSSRADLYVLPSLPFSGADLVDYVCAVQENRNEVAQLRRIKRNNRNATQGPTGAPNAYRKAREEGRRAQDALGIARYVEKDLLDFDGDDIATIDLKDGLQAIVRLEMDDSADLSHFGKWSDTRTPGAIAHYVPEYGVYTGDRNSYAWFIPETNVAETRAYLHASGYSRHAADLEARSYARKDYDRVRTCGDTWHMLGVVVSIRENDTETTTGKELSGGSLWGIESDSDKAYFAEVARDLIHEHESEARAKFRGTLAHQLEQMVDKHTLGEVLETLGEVCGMKAQHVRETWQDEKLATKWDKMRATLERTVPHAHNL